MNASNRKWEQWVSSPILMTLMLVALLLVALLLVALPFAGCSLPWDRDRMSKEEIAAEQAEAEDESENREDQVETVIDEETGMEIEVYKAFDNGNPDVVHNNPENPTYFHVDKKTTIYHIQDYHWNGADGVTPGTIAIKNTETGEVFGPWQAEGQKGQFDTPNAYWNVYPDVELPPGKYEVIDSDPSTWSNNAKSGNAGVSRIKAYAE
jgi:hypothetical protein